jgi:hypothetical protein
MNAPAPKIILQPLSIELGDENSKAYKSIDRITWRDIPAFAVLTGLNGSGKTQFLQVLAYKLSKAAPHLQYSHLNAMPLAVTGDEIGPHGLAYLPSAENTFRVQGANISGFHQAKEAFLQQILPQNAAHNIEAQILRERIQRKYDIRIDSHPIRPELIAKLPDDFMYMLEYGEVSAGLSHVFVGYQIRRAEKLMDGQSEDHILKELGQPPWAFVNEALSSAEFGYRIVPPENKLMKDYRVKVVANGSNMPL